MKIRNGFVSNSSSSSFLIYGVYLEELGSDELDELKGQAITQGLNAYTGEYNDTLWVGLEWDQVQDNETGAEFKKRVKDMLTKLLNQEPEQLATYSEAWYNG